MASDDSDNSDCYCTEDRSSRRRESHHPNTPTSPVKAPTPAPKVQFYDHSVRYHREYKSPPVVERLTSREVDAGTSARMEQTQSDMPVNWVRSGAGRTAQREVRGLQALARERVHQDYRQLLDTLKTLSREERLLRSTQLQGPTLDFHQSDARRKARQVVRQRNMDSAFERVLYSSHRPEDAASTVTSHAESFRTFTVDAHDQEPAPMLNVAQLHKFVTSSTHHNSETRATAAPSPSSPEGSFVVGRLPDGVDLSLHCQTSQPASRPAQCTIESLIERVNMQRKLLMKEVGQDLRVLGSNLASLSERAQTVKCSANKDLSFSSGSSNTCLVTSNKAPLPAKGLSTLRVMEDVSVERNEYVKQIRDKNMKSFSGDNKDLQVEQKPWESEHKKNLIDHETRVKEVWSPEIVPSVRENLERFEGSEMPVKGCNCRCKERHSEKRECKLLKKKKRKVKLVPHTELSQVDNAGHADERRQFANKNEISTVVSGYSLDVSLSKMELSNTITNGQESSSSTSTSYEGVKIVVSVFEKSQNGHSEDRKEHEVCKPRSIEDNKTEPVPDTSKNRKASTEDVNETKEQSKTKHKNGRLNEPAAVKSQRILHAGKLQLRRYSSRSPRRPNSKEKNVGRQQSRERVTPLDVSSKGNKRPTSKEKKQDQGRQSWSQKFKRRDPSPNLDPSTSTSYNSPPDELAINQSNIVSTLLLTIDKQQEKLDALKASLQGRLKAFHSNSPVDPTLAHYIERLLCMSRERIESLNITSSDVPTPSSSVVNCSSNDDGENVHTVESLLDARVQQISQELSHLEEECMTDDNNENIFRLITDRLREDVQADKLTDDKKHPEHRSKVHYGKTDLNVLRDVSTSPFQEVPEFSTEETIVDVSVSSTISDHHRKFLPPSPIPHVDTNHSRQKFQIIHNSVSEKHGNESFSSRVDGPGLELKDYESNFYPQLEEKFEGLTQQCSERINSLSQLIDQVRIEKQQILEGSRTSGSTNCSPTDEHFDSTRYVSPPLSVLEPAGVAPPKTVSPNRGTRSPDSSFVEEQPVPAPTTSDAVSSSGVDVQNSTSLVARAVFLTEPNDRAFSDHISNDHFRFTSRHKPPASLWRNLVRNDIPDPVAVHELSTILEVDMSQSRNNTAIGMLRSASNESKPQSPPRGQQQTSGHVWQANEETMPDVMAEMLRRNLISSPLPLSISADENNADSDTSQNNCSYYASMLVHNTSGIPQKNESEHETSPSNRPTEPKTGSPSQLSAGHFPLASAAWQEDESELTSQMLQESSNGVDSSPEDLERVFKKLGLGWAGATLRKTQQAKDLSPSSSSDLSNVHLGRTPPVARPQSGEKVKDSSPSTVVTPPGVRLSSRAHSTPKKITSVSSDSVENGGTSESGEKRSGYSFTAGSEFSAVRSLSSPEENASEKK